MLEELEGNLWEHCLSRLVRPAAGQLRRPAGEMMTMLLCQLCACSRQLQRCPAWHAYLGSTHGPAGLQVDYGHTFSPEIEMAALNTRDMLLHGEAVNIDMAITTQLAHQRGMLSLADRNRVFNVMEGLGLSLWHDSCSDLPMLLRVGPLTACARACQCAACAAPCPSYQPAASSVVLNCAPAAQAACWVS